MKPFIFIEGFQGHHHSYCKIYWKTMFDITMVHSNFLIANQRFFRDIKANGYYCNWPIPVK